MKRDIDLKTENVKKMGKQVSTTLKGSKYNYYIYHIIKYLFIKLLYLDLETSYR